MLIFVYTPLGHGQKIIRPNKTLAYGYIIGSKKKGQINYQEKILELYREIDSHRVSYTYQSVIL